MHGKTIQDILPRVQLPSRYLGNEVNRIKKQWHHTKLHIALAFPDLYEIATSHFGIQILYNILNQQEEIMAERVFAPAIDMEQQLRQNQLPLASLESGIPIARFDMIGFSLLYELNYTNMLNMLNLGNIPFLSKDRGIDDPLVIGGGPCTCNPEPIADFFDAIVIGDGERVFLEMTSAWFAWKASATSRKDDLLESWSTIEGVYIPTFFESIHDPTGFSEMVPQKKSYRRVKRAVVHDMNAAPVPLRPVLPFGRPVHDRLRMEIARGCTRGCRFCQAGMIYRPVRERDPNRIIDQLKTALECTGYEDISLLSLSTGDYSCIAPLMKSIMEFGAKDHIAVSLPSLRAGSLTPELMDLIKKVRKTGFTIAPEAGSQRLRDVINKNITEKDIVETVENAFRLGWKVIKLYFMIGLPTETQADLDAVIDLVEKIKSIAKGKQRLNVSFATFVPKPHTPFQWESQITLDEAIEKLDWLKTRLNGSGIQVKWQDPKVSLVEAVWSRGDRRLSRLLIDAWEMGCRFDGWSDFFNYDRWMSVFEKNDIDPAQYTRGWDDIHRPLPWEHIDIGVSRSYLLKERERGLAGKITQDCRTGECSGCGVCDFKTIQPRSYHQEQGVSADPAIEPDGESNAPVESFKYLIRFKKTGNARFLGHLEMVKLFIRGLRRAKIPVRYSRGYHPMPKLSFKDTLPMGMESEGEQMLLSLTRAMPPEEVAQRLDKEMPDGFKIIDCAPDVNQKRLETKIKQRYLIQLKDGFFAAKDLESFKNSPLVEFERKNKRGKKVTIDLKQAVDEIVLIDDKQAAVSLQVVSGQTVRPAQVLQTVFHLDPSEISSASIKKKQDDV